MGHLFSKPVNSLVINHLRSLHKDGHALYKLNEFEAEIPLSSFLGRENAPTCHMVVVNASIRFRDLQFDGPPLRIKSSKIIFKFELHSLTSSSKFYVMFEHGIRVSDVSAETTVKKIKTQIRFGINGTDHSHLANTLLSIDNPQVASNLLNAVFLILKESKIRQKEDLKEALNQNIKEVASQYRLQPAQ